MRTTPPPPNRRIADIERERDAAEFTEFVIDAAAFAASIIGMGGTFWLAAFIF